MVTQVERRNWDEWRPTRTAANGVPLTGAAAQTRASWARRIDAMEDLPDPYREPVRLELRGTPLAAAVLCPASPRHATPTPETLVVAIGDRLHLFARRGAAIAAMSFEVGDILAIDVGDVLLDSWLTFRGRAADSAQTATVRFNTVGMELLLPFVDLVRPPARDTSGARSADALVALETLSRSSLKFYNLARSLLRAGDRVLDVRFQPAIQERFRGLPLPFLRREIAPAHLVLLTESELIIASDIDGRGSRDDRYGHVRTHLPLRHVVGAHMASRVDGLWSAWIDLPAGAAIEVVFERATAPTELVANLRAAAT